MRYLLFAILLIIRTGTSFAQEGQRRNAGYVEILGNGIVLSANYERQLTKIPAVALHIGIGLGGYGPAIPIGVRYMMNFGNQRSFLETGVGITLAERGVLDNDFQNYPGSKKYKFAFVPSVGYRYHARSGFLFRANYTPILSEWDNHPLFFGLSFGWRIK